RTTSSIGIQGADVDPDGYAEAAGNLKAQGSLESFGWFNRIIITPLIP
uniref:Uncharacterized protein n=1 Tax=Oryza glaberrima TaxID=4538 RepID=I1QHH2_ORYGL